MSTYDSAVSRLCKPVFNRRCFDILQKQIKPSDVIASCLLLLTGGSFQKMPQSIPAA